MQLTAAPHSPNGARGNKSAWQVYLGGRHLPGGARRRGSAAALINRADVRRLALIATGAGLIFTIDQTGNPPGPTVPAELARSLALRLLHNRFAWTAGADETVATVALVAAGCGLAVTLAARQG